MSEVTRIPTLAELHARLAEIDGGTLALQLHEFLGAMNRHFGDSVRIWDKEVVFTDAKQRRNLWGSQTEPAETLTAEQLHVHESTRNILYGLLTAVVQGLSTHKTLYLFSGRQNIVWENSVAKRTAEASGDPTIISNARQKWDEWMTDWHNYGLLITGKTWYIYDPNYSRTVQTEAPNDDDGAGPSARRLRAFPWLSRVEQLRQKLQKSSFRPSAIYVGGDGDNVNLPQGICRSLTLRWMMRTAIRLRDGVEELETPARGWEKLAL